MEKYNNKVNLYIVLTGEADDGSQDDFNLITFDSYKQCAKYLYANYNNTGSEISINDTVCMGVGDTPYIDKQDAKYVPTFKNDYPSCYKHIRKGYKGLAKALKACTKYYEGDLVAMI